MGGGNNNIRYGLPLNYICVGTQIKLYCMVKLDLQKRNCYVCKNLEQNLTQLVLSRCGKTHT